MDNQETPNTGSTSNDAGQMTPPVQPEVATPTPQPSPTPTPQPTPQPEMTSVKTTDLKKVIETIESLQKSDKEKQGTIDMLLATADKGRMARYRDMTGKPLGRDFRVRVFKGMAIVGWGSMIEDIMEKGADGRWHERQIVELITEDEKKWQMPYSERAKLTSIEAVELGRSISIVDGDERTVIKLQVKDNEVNRKDFPALVGKVYEIDTLFLN